MHDLALVNRAHWTWRFTIMLTLALLVAVMGLLANSAAVVIGAMLLAPLMTPVLGTAAALAMGLPRKIFISFARVVLATAWCILLAYLVGRLNLTATSEFTDEITARVQPTLLDLVVAVAAGTAGAYATVRSDTSGALPGVAVAVALVPPLGAVGLTLEAGNMTFAFGAMLLYTTNLTAIVFAGIVVFVTTGFVPPRRLVTTVPRILGGLIVALFLVAVITVPLARASRDAAASADRERDIREAVDEWLTGTAVDIDRLTVDDNSIVVEISGVTEPPSRESLQQILDPIVDSDVQLAVFFDEKREPTTTTIREPTESEQRDMEVRTILAEWLAANDQGNDYRLTSTEIEGNVVTVVVSGSGESPPIDDLIDRLAVFSEADRVVPNIRWSELETVPLTVPGPTAAELQMEQYELVANTWASRRGGEITAVDLTDGLLTIEVRGPTPLPIEPLLGVLATTDQPPDAVEVFFTQRVVLETTTTTVPPTTTTDPDQTTTTEG